MSPDRWGFTVTNGQNDLQNRYPGIRDVTCYGIIETGFPLESSTWLRGTNRWWDKLGCVGSTADGKQFFLVCDAKGPNAWVIYRLKLASLNDLAGY
jgi:hypothetical protein